MIDLYCWPTPNGYEVTVVKSIVAAPRRLEDATKRFVDKPDLGTSACAIRGCKAALIRPFGRSIALHRVRYSPQSTGRRDGDSGFSLSRLPKAEAPSLRALS